MNYKKSVFIYKNMSNIVALQEATRNMFDETLPEDGSITIFSQLLKKEKTVIFITDVENDIYYNYFYRKYSKEYNTLYVTQSSDIFLDLSKLVAETSNNLVENAVGWILVYNENGKIQCLHNSGLCKPLCLINNTDTMYVNY
jgi:hypothetical protein